MYGKKMLATLMALFAMFALTGCRDGTISSVNEEDYYPHFEIKADKISHFATKLYTDFKDCESDAEVFKSKGAYEIIHYSPDIIVRYNPLSEESAIEKARLKSEYGSSLTFDPFDPSMYDNRNHMSIDVLGDSVTRNNELFEKIFGYESNKIILLRVEKCFSENNISYFETYGKLLEQQGYEKSEHNNEWGKKNFITGIEYWWGYYINQDSSISAIWHIDTRVNSFFNWFNW
jgi:hypothetical protein